MKPQLKIIASSVLLASALMLTACSSDNQSTATIAPTLTPTLTTSPTASPATIPTATATPIATTPTITGDTDANSKLINDLMALAKIGKVPDVKYGAHTGLIDDVEKAWGKADKEEPAGKGIYATYSKKNVVFGFNKGSQIFDVRSSDPVLQKLTLKEIEHVLAKPDDTTINGNDTIYVFKANDQYQIKFVIPKSTGKVDHISVFSPQDSINNMAG